MMKLACVGEMDLGQAIGQCRAVPVELGPGQPAGILAAYGADFDVDPWVEMFFYPKDTLKLVLFTGEGEVLWKKDLGPGVVPGMWFCPVLPLDLDGDGRDEVYFVNNLDPKHPLAHSKYCLQRLDSLSGQETGQWPWECLHDQPLSHTFRNFLIGGYAGEEPVLVSAQGTYEDMHLQGWGRGMVPRWRHDIEGSAPGARGSHMCPVVDIDDDGNDELMWGERAVDLGSGQEQFCADRDEYRGHSDVVIPVLNRATGRWVIYTARESDGRVKPRVATFDDRGRRMWGDVEEGHMDMGWAANWDGGRKIAMAIRIGHKTCGPDGRFHTGMSEFVYDVFTGERLTLPMSVYRTVPVDLDGDGLHELVRGIPSGDGEVIDRVGRLVGNVGGAVALACKFLQRPGEQLLSYSADGKLRMWVDENAQDRPAALARYRHRFYRANRRLSATGWNLGVLSGV